MFRVFLSFFMFCVLPTTLPRNSISSSCCWSSRSCCCCLYSPFDFPPFSGRSQKWRGEGEKHANQAEKAAETERCGGRLCTCTSFAWSGCDVSFKFVYFFIHPSFLLCALKFCMSVRAFVTRLCERLQEEEKGEKRDYFLVS